MNPDQLIIPHLLIAEALPPSLNKTKVESEFPADAMLLWLQGAIDLLAISPNGFGEEKELVRPPDLFPNGLQEVSVVDRILIQGWQDVLKHHPKLMVTFFRVLEGRRSKSLQPLIVANGFRNLQEEVLEDSDDVSTLVVALRLELNFSGYDGILISKTDNQGVVLKNQQILSKFFQDSEEGTPFPLSMVVKRISS